MEGLKWKRLLVPQSRLLHKNQPRQERLETEEILNVAAEVVTQELALTMELMEEGIMDTMEGITW